MASSTRKKPTTTKKGGGKAGASRAGGKKAPPKQPIRREVGAVAALVLALLVAVSYFDTSAFFVNGLANVLKGLMGYGYWLAAPALVLAGGTLLFHHGRPVCLRVTCALLLPLVFGIFWHAAFCRDLLNFDKTMIPLLWRSGRELASGGVIAGLLATGSVRAFTRIATVILSVAAWTALLVTALLPVLRKAQERHRTRPCYVEEPEEPRPQTAPTGSVKRRTEEPLRIDIPLDDGVPAEALCPAPQKEGRFTGFFRHKSDQQKTPDQVLLEQPKPEKKSAVSVPAIPDGAAEPVRSVRREVQPAAEPVRQAPVVATAPEEAAPARKEKSNTAKEVADQTAAVAAEIQQTMASGESAYQFPPITLLRESQGENHVEAGAELRNNSRRLADTLTSFGVDAAPGDVVHGPSVTRYEFVLEQGVKLSKITNLADDIALALGATGVRIAPIPDKSSVVGIEVPNKRVTPVLIRDVIESRDFTDHRSKTAFALGRDIGGRNVIGDIEKLPHVLIAGTTGSGKSVCTNSLIISLLYKSTPDEVRFIMVDPKMVELAPYNGIPHLLIPVVTDPKKAAGALQWAVFEMMKRYKTFSEHGVKKLEEFNRLARASEDLETLPSVVVVIDELADLMLVAAKEVEESICRVAQMGRAAGVHLVIATQRPSADVITGLMKANIPSRIAFAVASSLESRIILDNTGAEKLVGKGDMLYAPLGGGKPQRVQGCFISPEEIEEVVSFVKQSGEAQYSDEVIAKIEESIQEKEKGGGKGAAAAADVSGEEGDELLPAAVDVVLETGQASVSMLQRRLKLGYSRAARLVDQMEERGIVGPFEGSKPRQLLITREQWQEMQMGGAPASESGDEECPFPEEDT